MPKTEKKLKAMVKSHYSHEIRKDVDLSSLHSLKLDKAWPLIRNEIEKEIGSDSLVCVPFVEETTFYSVSSVFGEDSGAFKPLGRLADFVDEDRSDAEFVQWLKDARFGDDQFKFPHDSVKITLQDEQAKNKVRVIMLNFFRQKFPHDKSPVKNVYLKNNTDLGEVKSFYMITDVLMAKTVEFRATTGISSRIFHLGNPTPLLFRIEQFDVDEDGQITSRIPVTKNSDKEWCKVAPYDHLCTAQLENIAVGS